MGVTALLLFVISALLLLDHFLFGGAFYSALPWFAAPLMGFAGFITAFLWYRDLMDKPKTKTARRRRAAMAFMALNLMVCIVAACMKLSELVRVLF